MRLFICINAKKAQTLKKGKVHGGVRTFTKHSKTKDIPKKHGPSDKTALVCITIPWLHVVEELSKLHPQA